MGVLDVTMMNCKYPIILSFPSFYLTLLLLTHQVLSYYTSVLLVSL